MKQGLIAIIIIIAIVFFGVFLADGIWSERNMKSEYQKTLQKEHEAEVMEKKALKKQQKEREEKAKTASFYQKLALGVDVNILVIGDEIGAGSGASEESVKWTSRLTESLQSAYQSNVAVTNLSLDGAGSYAGYVRAATLNDGISYDLAILCIGENDKAKGTEMNLYYEGILAGLHKKYEKCSIISVLEAYNQEAATVSKLTQIASKAKKIKKLCKHYGADVVDVMSIFNADERGYENLTTDNVHPTDAGYQLYADAIIESITSLVETDTPYDAQEIAPVSKNVPTFESCRYISSSGFTMSDEVTYEISLDSVSGSLGMDYVYQTGKNKVVIYVNGEKQKKRTVKWEGEMQQHIEQAGVKLEGVQSLKLVFAEPVQAAVFNGIIIT